VIQFAVFLKALIDVLFSVCVSSFWKHFEFLLTCRFLRVNLLFFAERRLSFLTFLCSSDVVDLEGVVLFGFVFTLSWFPLLFQNVVQGAGFRKNRCTPV